MKNARILLISGLWVAILPHLGFPYSWKRILFLLTGLGLMYFGYFFYRKAKKGQGQEGKTFDNFSENNYEN